MSRTEDRAKARRKKLRAHFETNRDDVQDLRAILAPITFSPDRVWGVVGEVACEIRQTDPRFALSAEEVGVIMDVVAPGLTDRSSQPRRRRDLAEKKHGPAVLRR